MATHVTRASSTTAKQPLTVAAGPYGHPFHPFLVTIPIGAWVCSLIFDLATRLHSGGSRALTEGSYWLIWIGVVGAVVAAVFGLLDLFTIPPRTRARRVALTHMTINLTVVVLYIVNAVWRHGVYADSARVRGWQIALSVVTLGLLTVSGWLGGRLTYRYGVRVADELTQSQGFLPPRGDELATADRDNRSRPGRSPGGR
jgi:uncharacterized membrane protein